MAGQVAVSFEFFPPGDDVMGQQLWTSVKRLAPLQPEVRLGDLWCGWLDAYSHARMRAANPARNQPDGCARTSPAWAPRSKRCCRSPRSIGAKGYGTWWHCAAMRRRPIWTGTDAIVLAPADLPTPPISLPDSRRVGKFDISVARLSGRTPRIGQHRGGVGELEAQGGRGRKPRDHAVLLRYRFVRALSRSLRGRRHSREHRTGYSADHPLSAIAALRGALRRCRSRRGCASASTGWMTIRRRGA